MSLLGTMWLIALLSVLTLATIVTVELVQQRLVGHKQMQQAVTMAMSGLDYAVALQRSGKWAKGQRIQSPDFEGGRFVVERLSSGRIVATGYSGRAHYRLEGGR
jgi:hypothetical protein